MYETWRWKSGKMRPCAVARRTNSCERVELNVGE